MQLLMKQFLFNITILTLFYFLLSYDSLLNIEFYEDFFTSIKIVLIVVVSAIDVFIRSRKKAKENRVI